MSDIRMCKNEKCTKKETCYRFKAKPNKYRQSYGGFQQDSKGECKHYWEDKRKEQKFK